MKRLFKRMKRRGASRRGITIVEVVIALAFIVIVTMGAITLINSHTKAELKVQQAFRATTVAENAIECFRYYNDPEWCVNTLGDMYNEDGDTPDVNPTKDENEKIIGCVISEYGCTVTIRFEGENKIAITATDSSGSLLFETEYTTRDNTTGN